MFLFRVFVFEDCIMFEFVIVFICCEVDFDCIIEVIVWV